MSQRRTPTGHETELIRIILYREHVGPLRAVRQKILARKAGVSIRVVQAAIQRLRQEGDVPIIPACSGDAMGVYIAERPSEIEAGMAQLRSRIAEIEASYAGLARARERMESEQPAPAPKQAALFAVPGRS